MPKQAGKLLSLPHLLASRTLLKSVIASASQKFRFADPLDFSRRVCGRRARNGPAERLPGS